VKRKILAAFLLTLIAIAVALTIAHFSFSEMMGTVDKLSEPNEKLLKLNKVFEEITTLDQQQRAEAIQNPEKPFKYFLDQTGYLQLMIDSLAALKWDNVQRKRLQSLREILDQRNQIFVSYMKVKAELADNKAFSLQLDTLSNILRQGQKNTDSIVTTQRQTITRYIQQDSLKAAASRKSFLKKLFSKKKDKVADVPPVQVEEQTNVTVDTLTIAHNGIDIDAIQRRMRELEIDQRSQRKKLQNKELELIHANSLFINQLLNTLHEVENEELANIRASNHKAADVFNIGITRMQILMLSFFVAIALLLYFILLDISKSNYYRQQLEKARDHAEELSKIKQRFLANMSHEIRTPLQSIIGFSEQLKQQSNGGEAVEAIHSSSEHLLHIVNEVLDYSRIASGNFSISKEPFKLLSVVREIESAIRIQAQRRNLTFLVDTEKTGEFHLTGDAFRLRQILYNLLGNAVKFTPGGFVKLAVTTREEEGSVKAVFEITDSGIGMSEEELKRVFNQFEQANVDITKTYGGTGLGLSIVKSLVEVQNGTLDVTSKPGTGSTFRVALTFEKYQPLAEAADGRSDKPIASTPATHVFVVDDDPMILKLCGLILRKNEIPYRAFERAEDLLNLKPQQDVSHILMDIRMPGINGVELCKLLKPKYPQAKFIALTAHVLPEEKNSLLDKGFDIVLSKPFHEREIVHLLGSQKKKSNESNDSTMPDFRVVREMTMGDDALFQSIMQQFIEESDEDVTRLEQHVKLNNRKAVREVVHKLAGRFAQMGVTHISEKFHELEIRLVSGGEPSEMIDDLQKAMAETKGLLRTLARNQRAHSN
jgi:signal transduction histidine kinase/DNA-binding response OmpR family regulator